MKFKQFENRYFVRIDKDEEIVESLKKFCVINKIESGYFTGIGASDKLTVGYYNTVEKKFYKKDFEGEYEITGLNGNIYVLNGETSVHVHINFAGTDFITYGGHLSSAVISGTCEIAVIQLDGKIEKEFDHDTGLNIFKL